MKVKKYVKEWFSLSSRERTGMLVLLVLTMIAMAVTLCLRYVPVRPHAYDYTSFEKELALYRETLRPVHVAPAEKNKDLEYRQLFRFDPNTATKNELVCLGIEERIASRILSYREKGGRFRKKEDLQKIYGFDTVLFTTLAPYINIQAQGETVIREGKHAKEFPSKQPVELNASDTADLEGLKGIGPVLAARIIRYRRRLGGFYSVNQLTEVYGISDSLFRTIREEVVVDTALVSRITINEAGEAELRRHPYIGRYMAKAIITYRNATDTVRNAEELVKNKVMLPAHLEKIKPYLLFP